MALTSEDKEFIAEVVSKAIDAKCACPHGVDGKTAQRLIDFAEFWESTKKEAAKGIVRFIIRLFLWGTIVSAAIYTYFKTGATPPTP